MANKLSNNEKREFMELSLDEMKDSIAVIETCLKTFKYGNKCHWALSLNSNKVIRLDVSLGVTKKLYSEILKDNMLADEYNRFTDRAISVLTNFKSLNPRQLMEYRDEFFKLTNTSKSLSGLFTQQFTFDNNRAWHCNRTRDDILGNYYLEKTKATATGLDITDLRDLLRFIIQVRNNLTFTYAKELKEIRRHPLSNQWSIINPASEIIENLPNYYIPLTVVADSVNYDIYLRDSRTNTLEWSSNLGITIGVDSKLIRAYDIEHERGKLVFREISDYREVLAKLPKDTIPKQERSYRYTKSNKEIRHDDIEAKLRAEFARLL